MSHSSDKTILWIALGVVALCLVLGCCVLAVGAFVWLRMPVDSVSQTIDSYNGVQVGDTAPDFSLSLLNGDQVSLSDYRGKPVFVNFWATWCHYCVEEMPLIQESYELYSSEMTFLVVDEGDSIEDVAAFIAEEGYPFPVLLDQFYDVGDLYYVDGYPMSFFVDAEGTIQYIANGMMHASDMNSGLRAIGVLK